MRKLRPNKSTAGPTNLVFFDCETLPEGGSDPLGYGVHKLRFGCASSVRIEKGLVTRRKELTFTTCQQFWDWLGTLHRSKSTLYLIAHNVGFDASIVQLWERVENGSLKIKISTEPPDWEIRHQDEKFVPFYLAVLDDPPTIVEFVDKEGRCYRLLDTLNYWRASLAVLGESCGLPKLDMPEGDAPQEIWENYCRRDVAIIENAVLGLLRWVKEKDLGKFRSTAPSQAMAAYRHRFMPREILFHDDERAKTLERESYYGGQVEIFQMGEIPGPIHQLDVASLYPSVMRGNHYPYRLAEFVPFDPDAAAVPFDYGLDKIARVRVNARTRTYPVRRKDGVYHALGTFETTLAGPELQTALSLGDVVRVKDFVVYNLGVLFTRYVEYFYNERRACQIAGDQLGSVLCKLLMNSLYGKFGQKGPRYEILDYNPFEVRWGSVSEVNADTNESVLYNIMGDQCRKPISAAECETAFPAIASFVTAYGRERLQTLRSIAGHENCYYQAVDALYTNDLGRSRLEQVGEIGEKELGKLNLEGSYKSAEFWGINNYRVGEKFVRGCIKPSARKTGELEWTEPKFTHLAGILSKPLSGGVLITETTKRMHNRYTRGTPDAFGRVSPLILSE